MSGKGKILVVDDEDAPRMVLKVELLNEGYQVQTASDGDEAISAVGRETFDLVLLDIKMPRVNGFEVLKFIKEHHPSTKVVMLTSFVDLKSATESSKLGADGFAVKPYESVELFGTVSRLLQEAHDARP
jgi:DNA-binding NtrC family response regulator